MRSPLFCAVPLVAICLNINYLWNFDWTNCTIRIQEDADFQQLTRQGLFADYFTRGTKGGAGTAKETADFSVVGLHTGAVG